MERESTYQYRLDPRFRLSLPLPFRPNDMNRSLDLLGTTIVRLVSTKSERRLRRLAALGIQLWTHHTSIDEGTTVPEDIRRYRPLFGREIVSIRLWHNERCLREPGPVDVRLEDAFERLEVC